jgi:MoaA/NifB/PqqE/SkfB family radical SAM enzyme
MDSGAMEAAVLETRRNPMNPLDIARLAWKTVAPRSPEQVTFFVTARCNFRCAMCFYSGRPVGVELSLDEYRAIARGMPPFHWMMISGGEPFLREDLPEICRAFVEQNRVRKINLPTNAFYTDRIVPAVEEILKLRRDCFLNLGISLHAVGSAHDRITGIPGSFERAMETHRALLPLRRRFRNLGLSVVMVNSAYTERGLRDLIKHVFEKMDADDICIALTRGTPRCAGTLAFSPEQYAANCDYLHRCIARRPGYYFDMPLKGLFIAKDIMLREIISRTLETGAYQIPCLAGKISAVIDERGNLYACELRGESFGNLRDVGYQFSALWRGEVRRRIVEDIAGRKCFCTHECALTTSILFNPGLYRLLISFWAGRRGGRKAIAPHAADADR